ncbi:Hypothetical protein, predicted transmembrane protein, putative MATE family efflux protein [Metamycoplasma auris 15026]|uniref:Uncharacterized protein n=1 Tax=Metamycoplasma auris 15026 TaxID=1188233 RepID=N9VA00_9BACT|nr:hypothetical protein [Metamycoplasma auris]ENY68528.1 Hypothetical protein, predicted transmembrane protein, putative MATE family efflux protein [Metamycoplasma auris 15026]
MKKNNAKNSEDTIKKTPRTKKQKLNIALATIMFTGIIGSMATIPIVSTFFSSKQPKKNKSISDVAANTEIKEEISKKNNKKQVEIKLTKEIDASQLFNFEKEIAYKNIPSKNSKNVDEKVNSKIKLKQEFTFYTTGYKLKEFFNNKEATKVANLDWKKENEIQILNLDLVKRLNEFNKKPRPAGFEKLEFKNFIKEISNLKLSFTYSFKKNDSWYFYDTKNKLFGIEINNFFKQVKKFVEDKLSNKKITNEESNILISITKLKDKSKPLDKITIGINFKYDE